MPALTRYRSLATGLALGALALAALWALGRGAADDNPLAAAARAAEGRGYRFQADAGWQSGGSYQAGGPSLRATHLRGSGTALMTMTFQAGEPPGPDTRVAWPDASSSGRAVPARALTLLLPGGDPLGLVAAGHAVAPARSSAGTALPPEDIGGRVCTPFSFLVAGGSYLPWWQGHPRAMPVNADAGGLATFTAAGVLWQDRATDLPCRITATLDLPRVPGEQADAAWLSWTYEAWSTGPEPPD